ncbi:MAG TPA: RNA polymerase subunit sigma-24 [Solibacterales bacterium]|nr:RNA polymerase subunit sigma-24 [Bryobacterales bacterium]
MQDSDAAIVAQTLGGDKDAFRLLVDRYGRAVFRLAFRITGNESDAEDVVQEAFLRAYKQLHRYESRSSFGTWIYRIASNYALDLLRSRKRRDEETLPPGEQPASDPSAERLVFAGQVQARYEAVMAELTAQERMAFVLRHLEGQSIEEIGSALGIGASATKNSIFRAVQKLRRGLEPVVSVARCSI